MSFALLADTHNKPYDEIIASLKKHRSEFQFIAIAGDIIRSSEVRIANVTNESAHGHSKSHQSLMQPEQELIIRQQKNVLPLLRSCVDIAPTYLSLGNHEMLLCDEDLEVIRNTGVMLLDNTYTYVKGTGDTTTPVLIGGLTSGSVVFYRHCKERIPSSERNQRYPRITLDTPRLKNLQDRSPQISWLVSFCAHSGYHILLSHHPEYVSMIPPHIDQVCAGHAHGGQWDYYSAHDHRWKGIFAPGQGLFPQYTNGIYKVKGSNDCRLVVSRGLANTTWVPRICNPTEIVYISGSDHTPI